MSWEGREGSGRFAAFLFFVGELVGVRAEGVVAEFLGIWVGREGCVGSSHTSIAMSPESGDIYWRCCSMG